MSNYEAAIDTKSSATASSGKRVLLADFGTNNYGEIIKKDFSDFNNVLVSGTTGSGKTSFVVSLLLSVMRNYGPEKIKLIIYDSKLVDYSFMKGSNFLLTPIINDSKKLVRAAGILVEETEKRIKLGTPDDMPDIFFILDDYADASDNSEMVFAIQRLLNLSRKARVHIIIVTSTPTASVLSAEMKALIPFRIAFTTANYHASQMIIGESGAENLRYPGEFICKYGGNRQTYDSIIVSDPKAELQIIQNSYISKQDMLADMAAEIFSDTLQDVLIQSNDYQPQDELIEDAIAFIFQSKQASVSMLQRRFRIGYNRAAQIIDEIEGRGIIGSSDGSMPRPILITENEYYGSSCKDNVPDKKGDEESIDPRLRMEITLTDHQKAENTTYILIFDYEDVEKIYYKKKRLFHNDSDFYMIKLNKDPEIFVQVNNGALIPGKEKAEVLGIYGPNAYGDKVIIVPLFDKKVAEDLKKFVYKVATGLKMQIINI